MGCNPEQARVNGRKGGRKPGSPNLRTRFRALQACREHGLTPLDVMLENLRHWHDRSADLEPEPSELGEHACEHMLHAARERAQQCAVDAAPYCHPRLAAIRFKIESPVRVEPIIEGESVIESQRKYLEYLKLNPPPG